MPFTVEDGTNVAGANAYTTVVFVDEFQQDRGSSLWTASIGDRESAIVRACDFIDHQFDFRGERTNDNQSMEWPRRGVRDERDVLIDDDVIPVRLQEAVAVLAVPALTKTLNPDLEGGRVLKRSQSAGTLSLQTEFDGRVGDRPVWVEVKAILRLLTHSQHQFPPVRV